MKVYKYRGSDDRAIFERDLYSIEKNYFWAPDFSNLNDPCETTISSDTLIKQSKFVLPFLGENSSEKFQPVMEALDNILAHTEKMGIYSLSKTFDDELLWAHYANSHKGFCIEYDLEILLDTYKSNNLYSFSVIYKKEPPSVAFKDIINSGNSETLIHKMAGYKSLRWKYEEEIRIITDDFGEHSYGFEAVKSIYFGNRMIENDKVEIMNRLKGRGIDYYQIERVPKTYKFKRKSIPDINGKNITYLCQISKSDKPNEITSYKIVEKNFCKYNGKATITIQLSSKLEYEELNSIAKVIKSEIFRKADRIFISFILKGYVEGEGYWATTRYEGKDLKTSINGLTIEQEKKLINKLKTETRNTIEMWIDETPFVSSAMILLDLNGGIILETISFDGSKSSKKLKSKKLDDKIRYDDFEPNIHGEYFVVKKNGILNYYSEDGIFKILKPFNKK